MSDDPPCRYAWWLLAALLIVVAARFVRLDIDPPYALSNGGEFLSDEGWYTQSAQLRAKFGEWTTERDAVWFSQTGLFVFFESVAFRIAGVSLLVARTVSVLWSCVALASFYFLLRTVQPRTVAFGTCLITAVTLHAVGYSRTAMVEPTGIAVSMLALLAWVRLPRGVPACSAALLLGMAAYFVKTSFIFTLVVAAALALGEAVFLARDRRWGRATAVLAAVAAVPFIVAAVQHGIDSIAPDQAAIFAKWHTDWRVKAVVGGNNVLLREFKSVCRSFYRLPFITGTLALAAVVLLGGVLVLVRTNCRPRVALSRAAIALVLWFIAGIAFFGLFLSQPVRYYGFAIFPLAFLAVAILRSSVPAARRATAVLCLFGLHLAVQVPGYVAWFTRDDLATADAAARDAVSRMDFDAVPGTFGVIGDLSPFLSFYDSRIRPLSYHARFRIAERVDLWRPRYLFEFPSRIEAFQHACSADVERVEQLASYRIMDNLTKEEFALYRIVYKR